VRLQPSCDPACCLRPITRRRVRSAPSGARFLRRRWSGRAKRALEVAAAGGTQSRDVRSARCRKTMLARRLPGILPELSEAESLEVIAIQSVAGVLPSSVPAICPAAFRAPHHSISAAGLIGGGSHPRPGEVSLAHHGSDSFSTKCWSFLDRCSRSSPADGRRTRRHFTSCDVDSVSGDVHSHRCNQPVSVRPSGRRHSKLRLLCD
jgi:hypothetical protein